jgi:hypothetical protein
VALVDFSFAFTTVEFRGIPPQVVHIQLAELLYNDFAFVLAIALALVVWRLRRRKAGDRATTFLLGWLLLELAGYLWLSPFAAARRVLGVGLVATLLVGRLAARRATLLRRRGLVLPVVAAGALLGLAFAGLDWRGAWAQKRAVNAAADWIERQGGGRVWFVGHWGLQFYAEARGMTPVDPTPGADVLEEGDWLLMPDDRCHQQRVAWPEGALAPPVAFVVGGRWPVRTVPDFYGGRIPLAHQEGPCLEVRVFRIQKTFAPEIADQAQSFRAGQ